MVMLTLGEIVFLSAAVLLIGISVSICIAFLYFLMRIIDRRIGSNKEDGSKTDGVEKTKYSAKKIAEAKGDDVPFTAPMKVETSFNDKRIGRV